MKLVFKAVWVGVLTMALSLISYRWSLLDPWLDQLGGWQLYDWLSGAFSRMGAERGSQLLLVLIGVDAFALALLLVTLASRLSGQVRRHAKSPLAR